jgi:hypothetical protein
METLDQLLALENTPEERKKYEAQKEYFRKQKAEYWAKNNALPEKEQYRVPPSFLRGITKKLNKEMNALDTHK